MKDCLRYAPMIGSRESELSAAEREGLSAHLSICQDCRGRLADNQALEGLVAAALQREAARRDFSPFVDQLMERLERELPAGEAASGTSPFGDRPRLGGWRRLRRVVWAGLIPALAVLGLIVYFHALGPGYDVADVVVTSEDQDPMVLQTDEGPLVVLGDTEPEST